MVFTLQFAIIRKSRSFLSWHWYSISFRRAGLSENPWVNVSSINKFLVSNLCHHHPLPWCEGQPPYNLPSLLVRVDTLVILLHLILCAEGSFLTARLFPCWPMKKKILTLSSQSWTCRCAWRWNNLGLAIVFATNHHSIGLTHRLLGSSWHNGSYCGSRRSK